MVAEEVKFDGSLTAKRQRFYVELEYGETTIVSWKKLLKDAKQKGPSSGLHSKTLRSPLGIKYDGGNSGKCHDSGSNNERGKHKPVHRANSSGQMQQSKRKVRMTHIKGGKNDGDSSIKPKRMDAKLATKDTKLSQRYNSPALLKDHPSEELQAPMVDVPILTYSRNPANFRSKIKSPPLNTVEDARGFPLKTEHNILQKTSPWNSRMKVGLGGDLYDKLHRNFKDGCFPMKINSTSGILVHDEVPSKCWHDDKSVGSKESIDAIHPCYKSLLKDPKAEKFEEIRNEIFAMVSNQQIAAYIPGAKAEQMFAETYNLEGKMEDKLCDLYELYLQGLGGDKDAQVHKLLVELAELWPKGSMDHCKLKEAINRSKSRRAVAVKSQDEIAVDKVRMKQVQVPCQKRKVTDLSDNSNCIASYARKTAPKKATIEQPVLQCKSSDDSTTKAVKLTIKQKPLVPQNVKVRFLLKQEHEALKASEKPPKDAFKHSRVSASVMCNQPS